MKLSRFPLPRSHSYLALCCAVLALFVVAWPRVSAQGPGDAGTFEDSLSGFVSWFRVLGLDVGTDLDGNGIPDLAHAALLDEIRLNSGLPANAAVEQAFQANFAVAQPHAQQLLDAGLASLLPDALEGELASTLAGVMTLGEPNAMHLLNAVLLDIYPGLDVPEGLLVPLALGSYNLSAAARLAAAGDADSDGVSNYREYRAAGSAAGFLVSAVSPAASTNFSGPVVTLSTAPAFGDARTLVVTGVVSGLPGNGRGTLVAYKSRPDGDYATNDHTQTLHKAVSNGTPWEYQLASHHDLYSVRMVFYVLPEDTEIELCPGGCSGLVAPATALASATLIRSPGFGAGAPGYFPLRVQVNGFGAVYAVSGNIGYNLENTIVSLWARPSLGYRIHSWDGDTTAEGVETGFADYQLSGPKAVSVQFVPEATPLTVPPPVAVGQTVFSPEDFTSQITLTGFSNEGSPLTYAVVSAPSHGTLGGTPPAVTYTPTPNFHGSDSFEFIVNDGINDSLPARLSVVVTSVNDTPVANAAELVILEDAVLDFQLSGSDADADPLSYLVLSSTASGSLTGTPPNLRYIPNENFNGVDELTFQVEDAFSSSPSARIGITVQPDNDRPVAAHSILATPEDVPVAVILGASDSDGDPLNYTVSVAPSNGTLSGTPPALVYTPGLDFVGVDFLEFFVNDGIVDSLPGRVDITIRSVVDAPFAVDQVVTTDEDTGASITLQGVDGDNDPLEFSIASPPANGTLVGVEPNVEYVPNRDFSGVDAFSFVVSDGTSSSAAGTVTVNVTPVNDTPVALVQALFTLIDADLGIVLSGTDADGDPLTYAVGTPPQDGTLSGTPPNLTYSPNTGFSGHDSFTYTADDGTVQSAAALVSISVRASNVPPVAQDQAISIQEDTPIPIVFSATDADGDALVYTVQSSPSHGSLSGAASTPVYTPAANYSGGDAFTFTASDGRDDSGIATVTIDVAPVNDAPVVANRVVAMDEDTARGITLSGTDVEGDSISFAVVASPGNGALSGTPPNLTYTPAADFSGQDSFTYTGSDGSDTSPAANIQVVVNPQNDAPVATALAIGIEEDETKNITLAAVDPDGDPVVFAVVTPPIFGTVTGVGPNRVYTPLPDYHGQDSFAFTASDGSETSLPAVATIDIASANDPPIAYEGRAVTQEDQATVIRLEGFDDDTAEVEFATTSVPASGSLSGTPPEVTYTPDADFNGLDSFTFQVTDEEGLTASAEMTVVVVPVNDAPAAVGQDLTLLEDGQISLTMTGTDPDGDPIAFTITNFPLNGQIQVNSPNVTYIPRRNYSGADRFRFVASDGSKFSEPVSVNFSVQEVNDPPVGFRDPITVLEDSQVSVFLHADDAEGDALEYFLARGPVNGALGGSVPNLSYAPTKDFFGEDDLVFTVSDGTTNSSATVLSINVIPVNDPPVALAQVIETQRDMPVSIVLQGTDVDFVGTDTDPIDEDDIPDIEVEEEEDPGDGEDTGKKSAKILDPSLSFQILSFPTHGDLQGEAPDLTFVPDPGFLGFDTFTFVASDGIESSAPATVQIEVYADYPSTRIPALGGGALALLALLLVFFSRSNLVKRERS